MTHRIIAALLTLSLVGLSSIGAGSAPGDNPLKFHARHRTAPNQPGAAAAVVYEDLAWDPHTTAMVICDMWDHHWCKSAEHRVGEMAPRLNDVAAALRARGVLIIHCPSDTMKYYADHPGRKLAQAAPPVATKVPLERWCFRKADREPALPIDDSDGGCDDASAQTPGHYPWTHENDAIHIADGDAITDSAEAFYLMHERGITHVIVAGVHENMCVLGRPFSIRQMVLQGQQVLLVRDLTDTMYNPKMPPHVDHFTGTDLMTAHIETYWCPTITSDQVLGGKPFRFADDRRGPEAN